MPTNASTSLVVCGVKGRPHKHGAQPSEAKPVTGSAPAPRHIDSIQRARLTGRGFSLVLRSAALILNDKRAAVVLVAF